LELPTRLAEARGESDVFAVACQYLVVTLAPILASAYVLLPPRDDEVSPEIIASYPDGPGLRVSAEMPAPAISRRVVAQLDKEPESVVFLSRAHPADNLDVTVAMTVKSLGACRVEQGADGRPVLLYALGEHGLLGGDRLVGEYLKLVSTLTRQHLLTLRRARMSKYFSPKVVELLMQGSGAAATRSAPEVAVSTTLFFDLRGFSLSVEAAASDLLELQEDLSAVITLVTQTVFERGGTVIDYQGDAVFAAWGVPFAQPDQALLAAQCALEVMHRLAHAPVRKLTPNKAGRTAMCGIGLCKGDVVAGTIGSRELFKFGVLGPSVNVSKRLESLSKPARLNAPILCCEGLARELQEAGARVRRVAQVRLEGMHRIEQVYELIDERAPSERGWGVEHDGRWNGVLSALESARSIEAVKALEPGLEQLPPEHPRTHWIRNLCLRLQSPEAIAEWDGIIRQ
jgi:class 3 adenylate cyclase